MLNVPVTAPNLTMLSLYSVAEIRTIEQAGAQLPLMQRAGQAAASAALALLPAARTHARVVLLAGPGNNGGDALETAALLAHGGVQVTLWMAPEAGTPSAQRQLALKRALESRVHIIALALPALLSARWDLVIDGLFGIGLQRPLMGELRQVVELVNTLDCPILALDVPSGLDADSGAVVGPDGIAVRATDTITFIGDKPGLHTCDGRDHAGKVQVARLGLDPGLFMPAMAQLNDVACFAQQVQVRAQNTHKGSFGNVAVIGGAHGMSGAPVLSARSALHAGAGRVFIGFADAGPAYDSAQPELMCRLADGFDFDSATLVVGPGLGGGAHARSLLERAIDSASALLIDADGLNLLATDSALQTALAQRSGATVLTPHPLEAARLLGIAPAKVQADRLAAARTLAALFQGTVVLKGSGSVIAAANGKVVINPTGNPALATAGTGDVLSGLCGALLAQGWPQWEAALGAVWLHGLAADNLVADGIGPIGLTAGELIPAIRLALNGMVQSTKN